MDPTLLNNLLASLRNTIFNVLTQNGTPFQQLGQNIFRTVAIVMIVIRPVTKLSKAADQISKGDLTVPELAVKGSDEISQLAQSFNRMYLSLVKAIRMLEQQ